MMHFVISCLVMVPAMPASSHTSVTSPAAWIASLHDLEQRQGRDAWSWQELNEARAAVYDSRFAAPVITGWHKATYLLYLQYAPALLVVVTLGGLWLAWPRWQGDKWGASFLIAVVWTGLIWLILIPLKPNAQPMAVIKTPGVLLRQGNGLSYALTLSQNQPVALSAGVEAQLAAEQPNGWVQIILHEGTRGWVPKDAVYVVR